MFNRKLREDIKTLELRINQLECPHKNVEIESALKAEQSGFGLEVVWEYEGNKAFISTGYIVRCKCCGKSVKTIGAQEKARMEYEQAKEKYSRVCGGGE